MPSAEILPCKGLQRDEASSSGYPATKVISFASGFELPDSAAILLSFKIGWSKTQEIG